MDITIGGCEDTVEFDAGTLGMECLGRVVQLDVTLKMFARKNALRLLRS